MSQLNLAKINSNYQQNISESCIYLAAKVSFFQDQMIFSQQGRDFAVRVNTQARQKFKQLLSMMDGTKTITEIKQSFSSQEQEIINNLILMLDKNGFIDEKETLKLHSGIEILLELETLRRDLIRPLNLFDAGTNINVLYGFIIESYYLISQSGSIYSPLLNFQQSSKIRQIAQEYYHSISGQEQLLLAALKSLNINQDDLFNSMPLAETVALSHGLIYWANYEPIFFISSLHELNQQLINHYSFYFEGGHKFFLDVSLISAIKELVASQPSVNLSRRIFQEIDPIELAMKKRLKGQTYLLIELFNNFYQAIEKHYSSTVQLLQKVTDI